MSSQNRVSDALDFAIAVTLITACFLVGITVAMLVWPSTPSPAPPPTPDHSLYAIPGTVVVTYADLRCHPNQIVIHGQCWDIVHQYATQTRSKIRVLDAPPNLWVYPHGRSCPRSFKRTRYGDGLPVVCVPTTKD